MGTPIAESFLQMMVRKEKLTEGEWLSLLEKRVEELLYGFLQRYTLPRLLDVEYKTSALKTPIALSDYGGEALIGGILEDSKEQGIYAAFRAKARDFYLVYGLTRRGEWIACTFAEGIRDDRYFIKDIHHQTMSPLDLHTSFNIPYEMMLRLLSNAVRDCMRRQREQLAFLEALQQRVVFEDDLLDHLESRP